ncbi:MAG: hypothetical protein LBP42_07860 [Treponema sp.]|jgi:hypothetical protein|nr:hypothetical protein [Treponema sp.]
MRGGDCGKKRAARGGFVRRRLSTAWQAAGIPAAGFDADEPATAYRPLPATTVRQSYEKMGAEP